MEIGSLATLFVEATEQAALTAASWTGRGDKEAADGAAVAALRVVLARAPVTARIVIGEGEKDNAPMLANGEELGTGGPKLEIAVDPVDGTTLLAEKRSGALSVLAVAPEGSLYSPGSAFYMRKLVTGRRAASHVDLLAPPTETVSALASCAGKTVQDVVVAVQDRPRHKELIVELRRSGARVELFADGDVSYALRAALPDDEIDALMGIGGTPEGVLTACALKCLGGSMQTQLAPQSETERVRVQQLHAQPESVLYTDDLARGSNFLFIATGITDGALLKGVSNEAASSTTHSLLISPNQIR